MAEMGGSQSGDLDFRKLNVPSNDPSFYCRLCFSFNQLEPIFRQEQNSISLADMIERSTGIWLDPIIDISCSICKHCRTKLESFQQFRRLCQTLHRVICRHAGSQPVGVLEASSSILQTKSVAADKPPNDETNIEKETNFYEPDSELQHQFHEPQGLLAEKIRMTNKDPRDKLTIYGKTFHHCSLCDKFFTRLRYRAHLRRHKKGVIRNRRRHSANTVKSSENIATTSATNDTEVKVETDPTSVTENEVPETDSMPNESEEQPADVNTMPCTTFHLFERLLYKCCCCPSIFTRKFSLQRHFINLHRPLDTDEQTYTVQFIDNPKTVEILDDETFMVDEQLYYCCASCEKFFEYEGDFKRHQSMHKRKGFVSSKFTDDTEVEQSPTPTEPLETSDTASDDREYFYLLELGKLMFYKCAFCDCFVNRKYSIQRHLTVKHKVATIADSTLNNEEVKTRKHTIKLVDHAFIFQGKKFFYCCDTFFKLELQYTIHRDTVHDIQSESISDDSELQIVDNTDGAFVMRGKLFYKCRFCDSVFGKRYSFKRHMALIHDQDIQYKRKRKLRRMETLIDGQECMAYDEAGNIFFKCPTCGKTFTRKFSLHRHLFFQHNQLVNKKLMPDAIEIQNETDEEVEPAEGTSMAIDELVDACDIEPGTLIDIKEECDLGHETAPTELLENIDDESSL